MRCAHIALPLAVATNSDGRAADTDFTLSEKLDAIAADVWIPGDAPVVRGMIVHAANYAMRPGDRWAEFCRSLGFGHVALNIWRHHEYERKRMTPVTWRLTHVATRIDPSATWHIAPAPSPIV